MGKVLSAQCSVFSKNRCTRVACLSATLQRAGLNTCAAFTLLELLVAMAVLALLMLAIAHLFTSATFITTTGNKHMDADAQARGILDRMGFDFSKMVKRSDVDYYIKQPGNTAAQKGNDQIAFFSEVNGYSSGTPSPVSLVAYRINTDSTSQAYDKMERLGKGLLWNGDPSTSTPMVFLPIPIASPLPSPLPTPMPNPAPTPAWPQAASSTDSDSDYELVGPQVFRLEYFYVLKGQEGSIINASILSDTPWDTRAPLNHTSVNGLQDVAAVVVTIAILDPKSRVIVPDSQLITLAERMKDFDPDTMPNPGDLAAQWQTAANASTLPRSVSSSIRIYQRTFYLNK